MAVAIMGGIVVATVLTLLFLPALYAPWFRVRARGGRRAGRADASRGRARCARLAVESTPAHSTPAAHVMPIAPIAEIIAEIKAGRMVVLVDDEDRENEGDLVFAAEFVTPEKINFLAKHGRGLVCMPITEEHAARLGLRADGARRTARGTAPTSPCRSRPPKASPPASRRTTARTRSSVAAAPDAHARRHRAAGPRVPADRAARRRAGARRAHRGLLRPRAARRPHAGGGAVRDHERRRHDGAPARPRASSPPSTGCKIGTIADLIQYRSRTESLVRAHRRARDRPRRAARSGWSSTATSCPTRRTSRWCSARAARQPKRWCACTSRCR